MYPRTSRAPSDHRSDDAALMPKVAPLPASARGAVEDSHPNVHRWWTQVPQTAPDTRRGLPGGSAPWTPARSRALTPRSAQAARPIARSSVASTNSATLHASRTTSSAMSALTPVGSVRPCPVP